MTLLGVTPAGSGPQCTCGASEGGQHRITCMVVAVTQPNAMVDDDADVWYPDNPDAAAYLMREFGARWLNGPPPWMPAAGQP